MGNVVEIPADANGDYWAPEVHKYNGAYYMFTTYIRNRIAQYAKSSPKAAFSGFISHSDARR